ncbi:hypothetical protein CXB51_003147 [Gossypium anomalum]|uniref:Aminotransferase-like plant mobile domain-containing protein n=1 Tax=Gossypium anomalum TaxID=47600 RepID=A0A8J5Z216_9ROSI|nr:hypothetical protein CXB51_003147 [Gossypium anomalum]
MIGRGCKLDSKLISALIERWRPETFTFHLPCGECTITLEDVHLQLGLPVDGDAVTGSVHSADWGAVCYELLGAIPDNINGGWIEMDNWRLSDAGLVTKPCTSEMTAETVDFRAAGEFSWGSTVLATLYQEMCGATSPNKAKIGGCLSLLQSWARFRFPFLCPRVDHPYTFPLITRWNHSASYARLPTCLEDIRLLLEQRLEAQVPLVNFAIVEMHQSDRVLRQFGFQQPISVAPEYDYIPTREPIIIPELACVPEYMPWFRIHGKPYLLSEEERQRQLHAQRERRGPLNPRRRDDDAGPSTAPTQSPGPATRPT